jgi:flagellar biosynthesis chaperone FliJ
MEFHKKLQKLYDQRSQAAHTANNVEGEAASETFAIIKAVLEKIISEDHVRSRDFLEKRLFGVT